METIHLPMVLQSSYCGLADNSFSTRVAHSKKSSRHNCPLWKLTRLLLLRKFGRNSRQVCWSQQRRWVSKQSRADGYVKLGGGIRKKMMQSQPRAKRLKHGRLANAHEQHMTLPNSSPDVWCIMQSRQGGLWEHWPKSRLISSPSPTRLGKVMLVL